MFFSTLSITSTLKDRTIIEVARPDNSPKERSRAFKRLFLIQLAIIELARKNSIRAAIKSEKYPYGQFCGRRL